MFHGLFLVQSTDVFCLGHILILSPASKISMALLWHPDLTKHSRSLRLRPNQTISRRRCYEFSKFIPEIPIAHPPSDLLEAIRDAVKVDEEGWPGGDQGDIPVVPLQVATNAVIWYGSAMTKYTYVVRQCCTINSCGRVTYARFL